MNLLDDIKVSNNIINCNKNNLNQIVQLFQIKWEMIVIM